MGENSKSHNKIYRHGDDNSMDMSYKLKDKFYQNNEYAYIN